MSGKHYHMLSGGQRMLRIDSRPEANIVEEITEPMPMRKTIYQRQAQYKFECLSGRPHPLSIEEYDYILVTVHQAAMDESIFQNVDSALGNYRMFSADEIEFIQKINQLSEVQWAIESSFDGIYVLKENNYANMSIMFKFAVYLKKEQATFWRLKFDGR